MKVIIVDDEKHVRSAITMLAEWDKLGIQEVLQASDGEEAVRLIEKHQPQIVLTDMRMPRKSGAELLTWLSENQPHMKTIVISGYDDFEYVRHAIRHGGMDYILKPVKATALNEALAKAVQCWRKEQDERIRMTRQMIEMNEMKPHYTDKLLTELVSGQNGREFLKQIQDEFPFPAGLATCSVAVVAVSQLDHELFGKFQNRLQLIHFAILNICNELLRSRGIAFRQLDSRGEIVLLFWGPSEPFEALLIEIGKGISATLQRHVHFGLALERPYPGELPRAYLEASKALWKRNALDPVRIHREQSEKTDQASRPLRLSAFEEELRLAALSGSSDRIRTAAEQWILEVRQLDSVSPEQLLQWNQEWEWMRTQWLDEGQSASAADSLEPYTDMPPCLPLNKEGMLSWDRLQDELEKRLADASAPLTRLHASHTSFIETIAVYLNEHYREEISLQDLAARFYLSREYIARKFKQAYGVTIMDYLSRIRIDRAKLLLHNPHLRVALVAEMVGYPDEKYFRRVFKKIEGVSPGEYRKEHTIG
ncbi:response regulator [Paenibacillus sp. NPDC057967]|uniref:response regulator transcription factor n=1 Tax=Paenibacillus sp. NPDC057967 TaxID=3346293 RepID=UPI0036D82DFA